MRCIAPTSMLVLFFFISFAVAAENENPLGPHIFPDFNFDFKPPADQYSEPLLGFSQDFPKSFDAKYLGIEIRKTSFYRPRTQ